MEDQADVIVLGMGPGGDEVAGHLAEAGLYVRSGTLRERCGIRPVTRNL